MMRVWSMIVMFFWCDAIYGQSRIFGTVSEQGKTGKLANVMVAVLSEQDTIGIIVTSNDGRFSFDSIVLIPEQVYSVKVSKTCFSCDFATILLPDTVAVEFGEIKFSCRRFSDCPSFDNSAYFKEHDSKTISNFDINQLKELMTEYPTMILEFSVCQLPGESIRLGKKRLKTFCKLLDWEHIDQCRICINTEIHYYNDFQLKQFQPGPGIFGIVKLI